MAQGGVCNELDLEIDIGKKHLWNYLKKTQTNNKKRKNLQFDHALQKCQSLWQLCLCLEFVEQRGFSERPLLRPAWAGVLLPGGRLSWKLLQKKDGKWSKPLGLGVIQSRSRADLPGLSNSLKHVFALTLNYLQMVFYGSGTSRSHGFSMVQKETCRNRRKTPI